MTKKIIATVIALFMALSMTITAFAATDGSITINNTNPAVSMNGHTYTAYELFTVNYDAGKNNYSYAIAPEFTSFFASKGLTTNEAAYNYVKNLEGNDAALQAFAKEAYAGKGSATGVSQTATSANTVTISGLDHGYYLVYDAGNNSATTNPEKVVAALALTTTDPTATVNLKADAPTLDKTITGVSNTASNTAGDLDVDACDAQIGKHILFELNSDVPDLTGYTAYTYTANDTFSAGLTNDRNMKVTIGTTDVTSSCTISNTDSTIAVTIPYSVLSAYDAGTPVVMNYSATLNESALIYTQDNPNVANLTYSNNPNDTTSTDTTPDSEVKVYTFELDVTKTNTNNEVLQGAKFVLKDANNNYVPVTLNTTTGKYVVSTSAAATEANATVVSDANGKIYIDGVGSGTYTLTETEAPAGYSLLSSPETVTITATYNTGVTAVTSVSGNSKTVINRSGSVLPSTGGIGTTIFTVGGVAIMGVAAVLLVLKRKKTVKE